MRVLAYVPDLMDRSRISGAAGSGAAGSGAAGSGAAGSGTAGSGAAGSGAAGSGAAAASEVTFVGSPSALLGAEADADLAIVDLNRSGVLDVVGQLSIPVIGFASHVDRELLATARAAGCGRVLARSAFFTRVAELLAGP
jgi:hypothetical protein